MNANTGTVAVIVTLDGERYFTGQISSDLSFDSYGEGASGDDIRPIELTIDDDTASLEGSLEADDDADIAIANVKVCDPTAESASIVHILLARRGYTGAKIDISTSINVSLSAYAVDSGTVKDALDEILWEYGYQFRFDLYGRVTLVPWGNSKHGTASSGDWAGDVINAPLKHTQGKRDADKIVINYWPLKIKNYALIYLQDVGYDDDNHTYQISVPYGLLWPDEANLSETWLDYTDNVLSTALVGTRKVSNTDFTQMVLTKNHTLEFTSDSGLTQTVAPVFKNKKWKAVWKNPNTSGQLYIYKCNVYADVVYRAAKNTLSVSLISSPVSKKEIDASYIHDTDSANSLGADVAAFYKNVWTYEYSSDDEIAIDALMTVTDEYSGVEVLCRVLSRTNDADTGVWSYKLQSVIAPAISEVSAKTSIIASSPINIDAESKASMVVSNPYINIVKKADGITPNLTLATTQITIWVDGLDDTSNWQIDAAPDEGIEGEFSDNLWTTSAFTIDSGKVVFTAKKNGRASLKGYLNIYAIEAGSSTLTPEAPTLSGSCLFTTAYLQWTRQADLDGVLTHQIFRSISPAGTFSKIAEVSGYAYTDTGLSLSGTDDEPTSKQYYYVVKRVVNSEAISDSSNVLSLIATPIPTNNIAAQSITAEKLVSEILNALIANINEQLTISEATGFTAGDLDPNAAIGSFGTFLAQSEIRIKEKRSSGWVSLLGLFLSGEANYRHAKIGFGANDAYGFDFDEYNSRIISTGLQGTNRFYGTWSEGAWNATEKIVNNGNLVGSEYIQVWGISNLAKIKDGSTLCVYRFKDDETNPVREVVRGTDGAWKYGSSITIINYDYVIPLYLGQLKDKRNILIFYNSNINLGATGIYEKIRNTDGSWGDNKFITADYSSTSAVGDMLADGSLVLLFRVTDAGVSSGVGIKELIRNNDGTWTTKTQTTGLDGYYWGSIIRLPDNTMMYLAAPYGGTLAKEYIRSIAGVWNTIGAITPIMHHNGSYTDRTIILQRSPTNNIYCLSGGSSLVGAIHEYLRTSAGVWSTLADSDTLGSGALRAIPSAFCYLKDNTRIVLYARQDNGNLCERVRTTSFSFNALNVSMDDVQVDSGGGVYLDQISRLGVGIIAQGENTSGAYVIFSSGFAIAWRMYEINAAANTWNHAIFNMPITFKARPFGNVSGHIGTVWSTNPPVSFAGGTYNAYQWNPTAFVGSTAQLVDFYCTAFGWVDPSLYGG
jgi:hypothetical protein